MSLDPFLISARARIHEEKRLRDSSTSLGSFAALVPTA